VVVEVRAELRINEVAVVEEVYNRQTHCKTTHSMILSSMDAVLGSLIYLLPVLRLLPQYIYGQIDFVTVM
jgi:hypothetical protein